MTEFNKYLQHSIDKGNLSSVSITWMVFSCTHLSWGNIPSVVQPPWSTLYTMKASQTRYKLKFYLAAVDNLFAFHLPQRRTGKAQNLVAYGDRMTNTL